MLPMIMPRPDQIRSTLLPNISAHRKMQRGRNLKLTSLKLTEDPHRRLNVLTNEWMLVSPHRATRPWQGEVAPLQTAPEPSYDPDCYLCPGNIRFGGIGNPDYASTFVFENDFAALKLQTSADRL